jgi:hypothetical protein
MAPCWPGPGALRVEPYLSVPHTCAVCASAPNLCKVCGPQAWLRGAPAQALAGDSMVAAAGGGACRVPALGGQGGLHRGRGQRLVPEPAVAHPRRCAGTAGLQPRHPVPAGEAVPHARAEAVGFLGRDGCAGWRCCCRRVQNCRRVWPSGPPTRILPRCCLQSAEGPVVCGEAINSAGDGPARFTPFPALPPPANGHTTRTH